jgi:hypothetical protein
MGWFDRLFAPRWCLYIVWERQVRYIMYENSPVGIAGYCMGRFRNGRVPKPPWTLHLKCNKTEGDFKLGPEHFTGDGDNVTPEFIARVRGIDPGWKVASKKPLFVDATTNKRIPVSVKIDLSSTGAMMRSIESRPSVTFHTVMDEVFGEYPPDTSAEHKHGN